MNVSQFMRRDPVTIRPTASLEDARQLMDEHGFGLLLVADEEGALEGFLTRGAFKSTEDLSIPVSKVRSDARFAVSPEDTVERAALLMLANQLVVLPVVDERRLVGIISQTEVLRALASALGIGVEGTRVTVHVRPGNEDIYRVLDVLREHDAQLLSLVGDRATGNGDRRGMVLRLQGVDDRERLCRDLEAALTASAPADA
ncbi:MAG: CBS domain-containing protein [Candidatus Bipolaricaulota bacterium]|nr:MAG: CBS domain-containing protein [Candidatus Bipolaricaulota bacterium]